MEGSTPQMDADWHLLYLFLHITKRTAIKFVVFLAEMEVTLLFLRATCRWSISKLSGEESTQRITRFDRRALCSSFRSFDCLCLMASLVARSAGAVMRATNIEVMAAKRNVPHERSFVMRNVMSEFDKGGIESPRS
jgi:hypothetical protein